MLLSWTLNRMLKSFLHHSHFHIEKTDSVLSASLHRWVNIFIDNFIHFGQTHLLDLTHFSLSYPPTDFFLEDFFLFQGRQMTQFCIFRGLLLEITFFHPIFECIIQLCTILAMLKYLKQFTALLYDMFISAFFTVAAHLALIDHMSLSSGNFLDIGCGTGKPLKTIVQKIKEKHGKIVGVDMHPQYTEKAINLFKDDDNVEVYNMDFYKIEEFLKIQFKFIFFSFSFMLMPDHLKAIELSKRILEKSEDSRIAMVLTLNKNKNSMLSWIKPMIKRWTSVDFGQVVYEDELLSLLDQVGLEVTKQVRVQKGYNLFLKLSPVYYIECKVKNTRE